MNTPAKQALADDILNLPYVISANVLSDEHISVMLASHEGSSSNAPMSDLCVDLQSCTLMADNHVCGWKADTLDMIRHLVDAYHPAIA